MGKKTLHDASVAKYNEFYTRIEDIENELRYYKPFFRGKTVLCNCDDPRVSNFFKYFTLNFETLGLKKVIATCYKNCEPDLFSQNESEHSIYIVYEGDKNGNRVPDPSEMEVLPLKGDGDFRSPECIELLQEADVVCTNPPFSLFRQYIAQLFQYNKKFLIIGNTNAATYKEIFPYIQSNQLWVGVTNYNVGMYFVLPDNAEKYHHIENGKKIGRVSTPCWWTNIENKRRAEEFIPTRKYKPEEYSKYDNYDAIDCCPYTEIPIDYDGVIGVPITFLGHYNPKQFEIVGFRKGNDGKDLTIKGEDAYFRMLIRKVK